MQVSHLKKLIAKAWDLIVSFLTAPFIGDL